LDCYLRVVAVQNRAIHDLSGELRRIAGEDKDILLLMTIPK
jgi:hypothetical protein